MNIWVFLGELSFFVLLLFFFVFSVFSLIEREKKAFWRGAFFFAVPAVINFSFYLFEPRLRPWLFGIVFILFLIVLFLMLVPPLKKSSVEVLDRLERIDERDVIFARFDLVEGTEKFNDYYRRNPEYRKIDDAIRKIPDILTPYHIERNPALFSLASAEFDFLEHQLTQVQGEVFPERAGSSPLENTLLVKKIVKYLGSDLCGVSLLDSAFVYSHVGRGPEPYGQEITLPHRYAVVFVLEMDLEMVASAPGAPVIVETGKKYVEAARISITLAQLIRRLGYPARAHIAGSNYQAMLPPLAWKAGLGELGRLGILITAKYGPRARLGLVTTDLPLIEDRPKTLGVQQFCQKCQKCARNCPSQAIPYGDKSKENGVMKWALNREECYRFWRKAGTDCAVCIFVCPYSKPANTFHNFIRRITESSSAAQSLSILADDLFYGRTPRRRISPLGI